MERISKSVRIIENLIKKYPVALDVKPLEIQEKYQKELSGIKNIGIPFLCGVGTYWLFSILGIKFTT